MKKIAFAAPIFAFALLTSCGGNKTTYNLTSFQSNRGSVSSSNEGPWYDQPDWWNYCSNGIEGEQATSDDIGTTVKLKVNEYPHDVRLIGIDHDDLADGTGKAHCTFEFANVLSDASGYSLTVQWNDGLRQENYDYLHSTINYALDRQGGETFPVRWAENNATTWSHNNEDVISMMPEDLTNQIKRVVKEFYINDKKLDAAKYWEIKREPVRLFLLSPQEMGYSYTPETPEQDEGGHEGSVYAYYDGHTGKQENIRLKKQANGLANSTIGTGIPKGSGQAYEYEIMNNAGRCRDGNDYGNSYWLRSPWLTDDRYKPYGAYAWFLRGSKNILEEKPSVCRTGTAGSTQSIAPVFCI